MRLKLFHLNQKFDMKRQEPCQLKITSYQVETGKGFSKFEILNIFQNQKLRIFQKRNENQRNACSLPWRVWKFQTFVAIICGSASSWNEKTAEQVENGNQQSELKTEKQQSKLKTENSRASWKRENSRAESKRKNNKASWKRKQQSKLKRKTEKWHVRRRTEKWDSERLWVVLGLSN
jgi:hypothetical protein